MGELFGAMLGLLLLAGGAVYLLTEQERQQRDLVASQQVAVMTALAESVEAYHGLHAGGLEDCLYETYRDAATGVGYNRRLPSVPATAETFALNPLTATDGRRGAGPWVAMPLYRRDGTSGSISRLGPSGDCEDQPSLAGAGLLPAGLQSLYYSTGQTHLWGPQRLHFRWYVRLVVDGPGTAARIPWADLVLRTESLVVASRDSSSFGGGPGQSIAMATAVLARSVYPGFGMSDAVNGQPYNLIGARGGWYLAGGVVEGDTDLNGDAFVATPDAMKNQLDDSRGVSDMQVHYVSPGRGSSSVGDGWGIFTSGQRLHEALSTEPTGATPTARVVVFIAAQPGRTDGTALHRAPVGDPDAHRMRVPLDVGGYGLLNTRFITGVDTDGDGQLESSPIVMGGADEPIVLDGDVHIKGRLHVGADDSTWDSTQDERVLVRTGTLTRALDADGDTEITGSLTVTDTAGTAAANLTVSAERVRLNQTDGGTGDPRHSLSMHGSRLTLQSHLGTTNLAGMSTVVSGNQSHVVMWGGSSSRWSGLNLDGMDGDFALLAQSDQTRSYGITGSPGAREGGSGSYTNARPHVRLGGHAARANVVNGLHDWTTADLPEATAATDDDVDVVLPGTRTFLTGNASGIGNSVEDRAVERYAGATNSTVLPRRLDLALGPRTVMAKEERNLSFPKGCLVPHTTPDNSPNEELIPGYRYDPTLDPGGDSIGATECAVDDTAMKDGTANARENRGTDDDTAMLGYDLDDAYNAYYQNTAHQVAMGTTSAPACTEVGGEVSEMATPHQWVRPVVSGFGRLVIESPGTGNDVEHHTYQFPLPYLGWATDPATGLDVAGDLDNMADTTELHMHATVMRVCDWTVRTP